MKPDVYYASRSGGSLDLNLLLPWLLSSDSCELNHTLDFPSLEVGYQKISLTKFAGPTLYWTSITYGSVSVEGNCVRNYPPDTSARLFYTPSTVDSKLQVKKV